MNKVTIYNRSPLWLQHFLVTLQGYDFENNRVNKKKSLAFYQELLKSQLWSEEQIRHYQDVQFVALIKEAFEHVPYYKTLAKDLDCCVHDFKGIEDLSKLPYLEKSQVRGNEHHFLNGKISSKNLLKGSTSGTTGSPLKLFFTRDTFSKRWAFELRLRNWAGLTNIYHPRRIQFSGRVIVPNRQKGNTFWRYNRASNTLVCSCSHVSKVSAKGYAEAISCFKPEFIDGLPSTIVSLGKLCLDNGYNLPKVKAIRVSAETLFDADREVIQAAFGGKVYNQYGSSESSSFCSDNSLGEMLVHPEFGHVEILSNGELVTTSFMNPVMPLIRYRIGDVASVSEQKASTREGRNFQRLNSILGRADDILKIHGKYISRPGSVIKELSGVVESQIVLLEPSKLAIKLVVDSSYEKNSQEEFLVRTLRNKIGDEVNVVIKYVNEIERGANGKFKTVVDLTKERRDSSEYNIQRVIGINNGK